MIFANRKLGLVGALILSLGGLVGCQDNPYPETGAIVAQETIEEEVLPELSLAVDDVIEFREGRRGVYLIRGAVAEPGTPEISVENLPAGASFDETTNQLTWTPDHFAGNDPSDPAIKSQIYPITVELRSSEDSFRAVRRTVNLIVHDVAQYIKITPSRTTSVSEGKKFSNTFTIENPDYPQGPFKVLLKGMPANMDLIQIDETTYKLEFEPDYYHVNRVNERELVYDGKIVVSNPANHIQEEDLQITVNDVRLDAKLVTPGTVTQGLDVSLQIAAYDMNKEVAPKIELLSSAPDFGTFTFSSSSNTENYSSVLNVNWNDIPPVHNGESIKLEFKACVLSFTGRYDNCSYDEATVKIAVRKRSPPVINRNRWAVEELVYLGHNERLERYIPIVDGEDRDLEPTVEIFPEEMRKYVSWKNDRLVARFDNPGVFQFNVKATSDYKVSSTESFIVEVFSKDRKKILMFADSTRDPEVIFYKNTFANMDIMNPAIQTVNQRNISDRETLVITTSTLFDKSVHAEMLSAIEKIENVVIASPLIQNLPETFYDRLVKKYDMDPIGRLSDFRDNADLSKFKFITTDHFRSPKANIGLMGTASEESKDPLIFNGGLFDNNKNCKGVLGISETDNNPLVIGLSCERTSRSGGGRIAILGTEWADLKTSEGDEKVPVNWFNTLLYGNFSPSK